MEVKKESRGVKNSAVTSEELAAINAFTKRALGADEVYTFAVRLCDNEVDRDGERFPRATLEELAELFVGKSGIFDHEWSAKGQAARIYRTEVVEEEGACSAGEGRCYLKGYAYMLRGGANDALIAEIEGGIKKEVSVGCSVAHCRCSVCGEEMGKCAHRKGILCCLPTEETERFSPCSNPFRYSFPIPFLQKNRNFIPNPSKKNGRFRIHCKSGMFFAMT